MKSLRVIALILTCAAAILASRELRASDASRRSVGFTQRAHAPTLRHVVLFAFKATATRTDIGRIEAAFVALPKQIPVVRGFEWGTNVSPENLANGFTHCFIVSFDDAAGRDAYLPHPAHAAFVAMAGPFIEKALVVDFVSTP